MNRRELLTTAGGVGLGLVAASTLSADDKKANASVADALEGLRIPSGTIKPNLSSAPVAIPSIEEINKQFKADDTELYSPKGSVEEVKDANGKSIARVVSYTCESNRINNLGFNARCVSYRVRRIEWKAGDGWPIYTDYCPVNNFSQSMRFPHAKIHQIVPIFGGSYWIGCSSSSSDCGSRVTPVQFAVNDDGYGDNRGTFVVDIISWSR